LNQTDAWRMIRRRAAANGVDGPLTASACQGTRAPRTRHGDRACRGDLCRRVVTASVEWVNDRTHGQQFKIASCAPRRRPPSTASHRWSAARATIAPPAPAQSADPSVAQCARLSEPADAASLPYHRLDAGQYRFQVCSRSEAIDCCCLESRARRSFVG
jgi:hypothetical protein